MSGLTKEELRAQLTTAKAEIADLKAERTAGKTSRGASDTAGLLSTELHVAGVPWNGTQRKLVRCAPSGEFGDKWLAVIGNRMFLCPGGQPIAFMVHHHLKASLQSKVGWDLEAGLAFLSKPDAGS